MVEIQSCSVNIQSDDVKIFDNVQINVRLLWQKRAEKGNLTQSQSVPSSQRLQLLRDILILFSVNNKQNSLNKVVTAHQILSSLHVAESQHVVELSEDFMLMKV